MKKLITLISVFTLLFIMVAACATPEEFPPPAGDIGIPPEVSDAINANNNELPDYAEETEFRLEVVATIFPQYDWAREIAGNRVNLTLLQDSEVDLHNFQPTVTDVVTIKNADIFIYVGGHSDDWVADILSQPDVNPNLIAINLMEVLEGNLLRKGHTHDCEHHHHDCEDEDCDSHSHDQHSDCSDHDCDETDCDGHHSHDHETHSHSHSHSEHNHDCEHEHCDEDDCDGHHHDCDHEHHHHHDCEDCISEFDEHVWMSLSRSIIIIEELANTLAWADPANAEFFINNANEYIERLSELDQEFQSMVAEAYRNVVLIADRNPFAYLFADYGIKAYAAFVGCSAETEASFETIINLIEVLREYELSCILITESGDMSIAMTIINEVGRQDVIVCSLNSLQSVFNTENASFYQIMRGNLDVLRANLNG